MRLLTLTLLATTFLPSHLAHAASPTPTHTLTIPTAPPPNTQKVNGTYTSFSIEYAYLADYAGNTTHPNLFSRQILQNLLTISGAAPYIRVGGSSCNLPILDPAQTTGVILGYKAAGADQPNKVTIGPSFFESFQQWPRGTAWVVCLNYKDNSTAGVARVIDAGQRVVKAVGADLWAFELGNEMAGWGGRLKPLPWDVAAYARDHVNWTNLIGQGIFGQDERKWEPRYEAGPFPGSLGDVNYPWSAEPALKAGLNQNGDVRSWGPHDYMGAQCASSPIVAGLPDVMNRTNMAFRMKPHEVDADYAVAHGLDYVLGETNSISCQGRDGASNVFGSALWALDYTLYLSRTNVSRVHFHQGTPFRYSAWQPLALPSVGPAQARPLYYGLLLFAKLVSGGGKQIRLLDNETHFSSYGVYSSGRLTHAVVLNMDIWNVTMAATGARPARAVKLPNASAGARVRRLTAAGADAKTGITWAGQTVAANGTIVGRERTETLINGTTVVVYSSEAVLVTL